MYRELLEEGFGENLVLKLFGEDTEINTVGFRTGIKDSGRFIPPAQFQEEDTVGYVRAMLRTVDDLVIQFSEAYGKEINIKLKRAIPEMDPAVALVLLVTPDELMENRLHCAVHAAATAIRHYGDRLRNSL